MTLPAAETLDVSVLVPAKDEADNLRESVRLIGRRSEIRPR